MRDISPEGYLTFPEAVRLWASITHRGKTVSMGLFDELAGLIRRELLAQRMRGYLLVSPPQAPTLKLSQAPGFDDGKLFEIAEHYWATESANAAISGRWVEAPVLEPLPPSASRQVNKGGYVLLEEKAIRALIAGEESRQPAAHHDRLLKKEPQSIAVSTPAAPDPSQFDPMKETDWTLGMAVAWIAYRSVDRVRESWPRWRREAGIEPSEGGLWSLMMQESIAASEGEPQASAMRFSVRASRRLLWEALRSGRPQAVTFRNGASHVIPAHEWGQLEPAFSTGLNDRLDWAQNGRLVGIAYLEPVQIERLSILSKWPPHAFKEVAVEAPPQKEAHKYDSAADFYRQNEQSILSDLRDAKAPHGQGAIRREAARRWNAMAGNEGRQLNPDGSAFTKANKRTKRAGRNAS
jgi:hypothetical protein